MVYREIEIFRAIMDQGSVTAAARVLGVSQPAVSHTLARLEERLGFSLFCRQGRRILPTAEAKLLHAEASRLLDGLGQFGASAEEIAGGLRGTLTIATNPNAAISWLPSVAATFRRGRPHVRLQFLTRSSEEVRALAAASAFDLGLAEAPFANPELVIQRYAIPRVVVLSRTHHLAACERLTPQLLAGEDIIAVRRPSSWGWANIARVFDQAGAVYHVVAECEFIATALNMVAAGGGICLVDAISAATMGPGLIQRPFLPVTLYEVGLLRPAHGQLTILARVFAKALHDHISFYLEAK